MSDSAPYSGPGAAAGYVKPPDATTAPAESHWYDGFVSYYQTAEAETKAILDWRDAQEDKILLTYANSDTGMAVDSGLKKASDISDAFNDTAKKWGGYVADPNNLQQTLDSVKWVLIAGAVVYGLYVFTPILRTVQR